MTFRSDARSIGRRLIVAAAISMVLAPPTAHAQNERSERDSERTSERTSERDDGLIARQVQNLPVGRTDGISPGLHGSLSVGGSSFLRSEGPDRLGGLNYALAAALLYQLTPIFGVELEQQMIQYDGFGGADFRYDATSLSVRLNGSHRNVTPFVLLGARTAWGDKIDQFGIRFGFGIDWKVTPRVAVTPAFDLSPVNVDPGFGGLSAIGAGVRGQLTERHRPAIVRSIAYPDTLWRDSTSVFVAEFDPEASTPIDVRWEFSDGAFATGDSVVHKFVRPGPHRVEIMTSNSAGNAGSELIVEVFDKRRLLDERRQEERGDPRAPRIVDVYAERWMAAGTTQNFRVRLAPEVRRPVNYDWDMGDGTTPRGNNVVHGYDQPGQYVVSVTARNTFGASTFEALITVRPPATDAPEEPVQPPPGIRPARTPDAPPPPARPYPRSALYSTHGIDWDAGGFSVLVATRIDRRAAERIAAEHRRSGYRTGIFLDDNGLGTPAYRVLIGQFYSSGAAVAAVTPLRASGISGLVVEIDR